MTGTVTFVVDIDAGGSPPAADSVRQLLALLEGLQEQDTSLDWRLTSISTNSPLKAKVEAFDRAGAPVSGPEALRTAVAAFKVLDATNDNTRDEIVRGLTDPDRKRLRALIQPLRDRGGIVRIQIDGAPERIVTTDRAQRTWTAINPDKKRRRPELGSIEGQIIAATTYYSSPALRVRPFHSGTEVICVFDRGEANLIGAEHTLGEVWNGRRVIVSGRISFDAAGRPSLLQATGLRGFPEPPAATAEAPSWTGEAFSESWGEA
jgi:hypothetical protein